MDDALWQRRLRQGRPEDTTSKFVLIDVDNTPA